MIGPMAESPAAVTPYDAGESVFDATANRGVIASGVREAPGWGGENGAKIGIYRPKREFFAI